MNKCAKYFQPIQNILFLTGCFCAALMLEMRFEPLAGMETQNIPKALDSIGGGINNTFFQTSIVMLMFIYIASRMKTVKIRKPITTCVLCFILSSVWLCGESFRIDNTLNNIWLSSVQVVKSIIYLWGATWLLFYIGKVIWVVSEKCASRSLNTLYINPQNRYLFWVLLIFILWLPGIIISYPATACYDSWGELAEYFGYTSFTAHHPPFFTILIGKIVVLGRKLGNINVGFFFVSILQSMIGVLISAYMVYTMRKAEVQRWVEIGTVLFLILCPYFNAYNVTIIKDTLYSYGFMLFVIEIFYFTCYGDEVWSSWKHRILFAISILLLMLIRHNGKYVVCFTGAIFVAWQIAKHRHNIKKICVCIMTWLFPILMAGMVSLMLNHIYGVEKIRGESVKESFSILFQQTARDVKENGKDMTDNEKRIIAQILNYDELAEKYNPKVSDPVKATFRYDATGEELRDYICVWMGGFLKHPLTYIEATMNQNYYLVYPFSENTVIYDSIYEERYKDVIDAMGVRETMAFPRLNDIRVAVYRLLPSLPIIGLLSCVAVYNIIMLFMLLFAAYNREWKVFIVAAPLLISDLIVVASPVVSPRYTFPIIYAMPILVTYYLKLSIKSKTYGV